MMRWLIAVAVWLASLGMGFAADLSRIDRTIKKEPKYTGKPGYCLLVFGPDARDRVWLVRDGEVLFADRNGNGDLTDPNEKIVAEKKSSDVAFHVGTVRVGKVEHRNLTVRASRLSTSDGDSTAHPVSRTALQKDKEVDLMTVSAEVEVPGLKGDGDEGRLSVGARFDSSGPLLFADTPANAPVLHFGGPLRLRSEAARPMLYRNIVHDLMLTVGTQGIGPGTFASIGCEVVIPKTAFVVVEAEFSPNKPGAAPIKQKYELKERC